MIAAINNQITISRDNCRTDPIIIGSAHSNITIEENANATLILLPTIEHQSKETYNTTITVQKNATLKLIECQLASNNLESQQKIILNGSGATATSVVVFLGSNTDQIKINTTMFHQADYTSGNMLCLAVLLDSAKADFAANINIPKNKKNIVSHQNMKCLTQGDNTKCDALPILNVESDDVICSHGAAIGRVEEESLYYLESRGIPRDQAYGMLLKGFLMQELQDLPEETKEQIEHSIKTKLGINND